jgi:hypothetical protein
MSGIPNKVSFKRSDAVIPLPEALTGFRSDTDRSKRVKWEIEETLQPEDTSTNFTTNTFKTTVLRDEASKFYRNRENVRIRIGYNDPEGFKAIAEDFTPGLLKAAEEVRINRVTSLLGFNTDVLKNGSEKTLGERLAEDGTGNAWNILVCYGLSIVGTKAFNSLLVGVRRHNKEWSDVLRQLSNEVTGFVNEYCTLKNLSSTNSDTFTTENKKEVTVPWSFFQTIQLAKIAQPYTLSSFELGSPADGGEKSEAEELGFAPLIIDKSVQLTKTVQKSLLRKYKSDVFGTDIRYPERLLTDPHRRIFGRKKPIDGGIVLIDTSGSMSLEEKDIKDILNAAPGALVMAYSHRPGSNGIPNLFILANRGKQVEDISSVGYSNIGNGVDGPALEYAIKKRFRKEPIIWVCDGSVTNSSDKNSMDLSIFCARLVVKHNITTASEVGQAIEMLKKKKYESEITRLTPVIKSVKANKI